MSTATLTGASKDTPHPSGWRAGPPPSRERLIIRYDGGSCCSTGAALGRGAALPHELAKAGVTELAWETLVTSLSAAQALSPPSACIVLATIPHFYLPMLPLVCCLSARFHAAAAHALAAFNAAVLEPRGMWAALQSADLRESVFPLHVGGGGFGAVSWLAIALTRADAQALRREPMYWAPAAWCGRQAPLEPHPCGRCTRIGCCGVPCAV